MFEDDDNYITMELVEIINSAETEIGNAVSPCNQQANLNGAMRSSRHHLSIISGIKPLYQAAVARMADFIVEHSEQLKVTNENTETFKELANVLLNKVLRFLPQSLHGAGSGEHPSQQNSKLYDDLLQSMQDMVAVCCGRIKRNIYSNGKARQIVRNDMSNSNFNSISGSSGIVVQQGRDNMTQSAEIDFENVQYLITEARDIIEKIGTDEDTRISLLHQVSSLEKQVQSKQPNKALINVTAKALIASISLLADSAEIMEFVSKFTNLF